MNWIQKIFKREFNKLTLNDMGTVDRLISNRNRELHKQGSGLFLTWTFPSNHQHEQKALSSNYFIIWVGKTGESKLSRVCFAGVWQIPELIKDLDTKDFENILTTKQK